MIFNSDGTTLCRVEPQDICNGTVIIPEEVREIEYRAFENLTKLTYLKIPFNVNKIGREAFKDCKNLSRIQLNDSLVTIPWGCFNNCISLFEITIPKQVETIEPFAFLFCSALRYIDWNDEAKDIYIYATAFEGCASLNHITIPNRIKKLPYAFLSKIESLTLFPTVKEIHQRFIVDSQNLKKILIPSLDEKERSKVINLLPQNYREFIINEKTTNMIIKCIEHAFGNLFDSKELFYFLFGENNKIDLPVELLKYTYDEYITVIKQNAILRDLYQKIIYLEPPMNQSELKTYQEQLSKIVKLFKDSFQNENKKANGILYMDKYIQKVNKYGTDHGNVALLGFFRRKSSVYHKLIDRIIGNTPLKFNEDEKKILLNNLNQLGEKSKMATIIEDLELEGEIENIINK